MRKVAVLIGAFLALTGSADAEPRQVATAEAIGTPAIAGDSVVYAAVGAGNRSELRVVGPDGAERVVTRMQEVRPINPFVALDPVSMRFALYDTRIAASPRWLAASQSGISVSKYMTSEGAAELVAAPLDGAPQRLPSICATENPIQLPRIDIEGDLLAYVREDCRVGGRTVMLRDLAKGTEREGPAAHGMQVRVAGRYVAFEVEGGAVEVRDLRSGATVYTAHLDFGRARSVLAFDLQADGTLATLTNKSYCIEAEWFSPDEPGGHVVGCSRWDDIAIDADRIALAGEGRLSFGRLSRPQKPWPVPGQLVGGVDMDDGKLAYATAGCTRATGAVWLDEIERGDGSAPPAAPRPCSVQIKGGTLDVDRRWRAKARISCPNGCRGGISLERGGYWVGGAHAPFEIPPGGSKTISLKVDRFEAPRLKRHGRLRAQLHVLTTSALWPAAQGSFVRRVTLRRPRG